MLSLLIIRDTAVEPTLSSYISDRLTDLLCNADQENVGYDNSIRTVY